jgi:hypothetical protein
MSFDLKIEGGDLVVKGDGTLEPVFNQDKLSQDILKAIFTPTNSHVLHKWYGSNLSSRVVGSIMSSDLLEMEIKNSIMYALKNVRTLQDLQQRDGQFLTGAESIVSVQSIDVNYMREDPRAVLISIKVLTKSGSILEESFSISR